MAAIPRTLVGIVTETPPTETIPIRGAKVEVVSGPNKGRSVTTDDHGYYSMVEVWGDFDVSVSKDGYDAEEGHVSARASVNRLDIALQPDAQRVRTSLAGRLCADSHFWYPGFPSSSYDCVNYPLQRHHFIPIHRSGTIEIEVRWQYKEDYSPEYLWLEVRCGSSTVRQLYELLLKGIPPTKLPGRREGPLHVSASAPAVCEIKPLRYSSFKGFVAWTEYDIEVRHPK
jgi:hypothetical protein